MVRFALEEVAGARQGFGRFGSVRDARFDRGVAINTRHKRSRLACVRRRGPASCSGRPSRVRLGQRVPERERFDSSLGHTPHPAQCGSVRVEAVARIRVNVNWIEPTRIRSPSTLCDDRTHVLSGACMSCGRLTDRRLDLAIGGQEWRRLKT
jgi:hypothetical protein